MNLNVYIKLQLVSTVVHIRATILIWLHLAVAVYKHSLVLTKANYELPLLMYSMHIPYNRVSHTYMKHVF